MPLWVKQVYRPHDFLQTAVLPVSFELFGVLPEASRLISCLAEEAEVPQELLERVLKVIAIFADGCRGREPWSALARGPYGKELIQQVWQIYRTMDWPKEAKIRNTLALLLARRHSVKFWASKEGHQELLDLLASNAEEKIVSGLLSICGAIFDFGADSGLLDAGELDGAIESHLGNPSPPVREAVFWAWGLRRYRAVRAGLTDQLPSLTALGNFLSAWFEERANGSGDIVAFSATALFDIPRAYWAPSLTPSQIECVRSALEEEGDDIESRTFRYVTNSAVFIALHAPGVLSDEDIANFLAANESYRVSDIDIESVLKQLHIPASKIADLTAASRPR